MTEKTIVVNVYNIKYNLSLHDHDNCSKYPNQEEVEIPCCLITKDKDYSWYIRSYLESKYNKEILGFNY